MTENKSASNNLPLTKRKKKNCLRCSSNYLHVREREKFTCTGNQSIWAVSLIPTIVIVAMRRTLPFQATKRAGGCMQSDCCPLSVFFEFRSLPLHPFILLMEMRCLTREKKGLWFSEYWFPN